MSEMNKFGKQTRYLIQDLYAGSLSAMPFLQLSGDHAWLLSDRARESRLCKRTRMKEFSTLVEEPALSSNRSAYLQTTSSLAKRSKTSSGNKNKSGSNQSTLSMISTPWSTESSVTAKQSQGNESLRWRAFSGSTNTTTSLDPRTTSTIGGSSSNGLSAFISKDSTLTDKERPEHVKFVHIEVPKRQRNPLSSNSNSVTSSWTLDAFTSAELFSDRMKVHYPWSPNTNDQIDLSIDYPSSFTLVSQKCSWDTINGRYAIKDYTPMNHIPSSGDMHPNHDWMLVKQKGITSESGVK